MQRGRDPHDSHQHGLRLRRRAPPAPAAHRSHRTSGCLRPNQARRRTGVLGVRCERCACARGVAVRCGRAQLHEHHASSRRSPRGTQGCGRPTRLSHGRPGVGGRPAGHGFEGRGHAPRGVALCTRRAHHVAWVCDGNHACGRMGCACGTRGERRRSPPRRNALRGASWMGSRCANRWGGPNALGRTPWRKFGP